MRHSAYKIQRPILTLHGTPKELEILELLWRYDLLPSDFIYHATRNYHATRTLLTRLTKGGYIGLPDLPYQEKLAFVPRNANYVYELKPKGKALLALRNRWRNHSRGTDHFKHKLLRSTVEYAIDHSGVRVIYPEDILAHPTCPRETKDDPYPWALTSTKPRLTPDITRGFEHRGSFAFLHVEVDRGTEPEETASERQNIVDKLIRYKRYLEDRIYYRRYGLTGAPTILFLTIAEHRKERIKRHAQKYFHKRFAFACVPDLEPGRPLLATWETLDGSINLMELLNGHANSSRSGGQTRESGARTGEH